MDQIDADRAAIEWLESRPDIDEIRWHNHENPGRTGSAWQNGRLVAVTTVLRDDLNYSVLVCHDLLPNNRMRTLDICKNPS
jgi:hypothetical protein